MRQAVIFGDSFVAARYSYARVAPALLGYRGRPMGLGGTGFVKAALDGRQPYHTRFEALVAARPDLAIVQASGNDAVCDLAKVRAATSMFLGGLRDRLPNTRVVVLSCMWAGDGSEHLPELRDVTRKACAAQGVPFVDALNWLRDDLIGLDGAHPTVKGHAVIALNVVREVRHALVPAGRG